MIFEKTYQRIYLSRPVLRKIIRETEDELVAKATELGLRTIALSMAIIFLGMAVI